MEYNQKTKFRCDSCYEYDKCSVPLFCEIKEKNRGIDLKDPEIIRRLFEEIEDQSIDYAVMEHVRNAAVLPVEMQWSDLGSWESLYEASEKDGQGNVLRGNVISRDTRNSLIFSTKKLVTSIGVENLIIVETDDALLVCDLRRSQDVKKLVETLKDEERHEYRFHTRVLRPWGSATTIREEPGLKIRLLEIEPSKSLTRHLHRQRSEHWVVTNGFAKLLCGKKELVLNQNESAFIPQNTVHRLENPGNLPAQLIEVQLGSFLGEDDIERFNEENP